jgi:tagatose 1,6-diphosphate aldolase
VPLEAQGYEDVAAGRVTTFLPGFSPALARVLGAAACKLLLPYRPDHEASAARQDEVVRQAVSGCHAEGLPLILEPIVYALPEEDPETFAATFPSLVVASAQRLQALAPDLLKVQFPRDDHGDEAARCTQLDAACGATPWVLLGGGGAPELFARDLRIACAAGASGFIAGRTLWTGVIGDDDGAETWLRRVGVPLLRSLRDIAQSGTPWRERAGAQAAPPRDWFA